MRTHLLIVGFVSLLSSVSLTAKNDVLTAESLNVNFAELSIDEQIIQRIQATEFSNSVVMYFFGEKEYPIRLVCNPNQETILSDFMEEPIRTSLLMAADLPFKLAAHIESLVLALGVGDDAILKLREYDALTAWSTLRPVYVAEAVDDVTNDQRIREAFRSQEFVNLELHYNLNGRYSPVRLLYNPERRLLSATRSYTIEGKAGVPYTLTWDHIYGVFTPRYVEKALINHIYDLSNVYFWEWYINFDVHNGTRVEYQEYWGNTTYYYLLDSWFDFTRDFR